MKAKTRMMERYQAMLFQNHLLKIPCDITFHQYESDMNRAGLIHTGDIGYKLKDPALGYTLDNIKKGRKWKEIEYQNPQECLDDDIITAELLSDFLCRLGAKR